MNLIRRNGNFENISSNSISDIPAMELVPSESLLDRVRTLLKNAVQCDDAIVDDAGPSDSLMSCVRPDAVAEDLRLTLQDVEWLHGRLCRTSCGDGIDAGDEGGGGASLHQLLRGCRFSLPEPVSPPRDPQLEARCQRLRREQQEREYQTMVGSSSSHSEDRCLNIGQQLRELNAQLVEIGQVLFSVLAAFLFGFVASSVAAGVTDLARRILAGLAAAGIVLVAEGYFLVRYLNAIDCKTDVAPIPQSTSTDVRSPDISVQECTSSTVGRFKQD